MSVSLAFSKYSGCGNDFIVIDNRKTCWHLGKSPDSDITEIARLCHRRYGIGAGGVIFLENATANSYSMRIFNSDGYEAEMCGNGIRCLAGFLRDRGIADSSFTICTMEHSVQVTVNATNRNQHSVSVCMPPPKDIAYHTCLDIDGTIHEIHCLNTGVPHAVLFVEDLECPSLMQLAPKIRSHQHFPNGTNVNFVSLTPKGIYIRTYERGVEGETLACGTGAVAAAFVASKIHAVPSPVKVHTRSSEILHIDTLPPLLSMTGPAMLVYQGLIEIDI